MLMEAILSRRSCSSGAMNWKIGVQGSEKEWFTAFNGPVGIGIGSLNPKNQ